MIPQKKLFDGLLGMARSQMLGMEREMLDRHTPTGRTTHYFKKTHIGGFYEEVYIMELHGEWPNCDKVLDETVTYDTERNFLLVCSLDFDGWFFHLCAYDFDSNEIDQFVREAILGKNK